MFLLIGLVVTVLPYTISYLLIQKWQNERKSRNKFSDDELIFPDGEEKNELRWDLIISTAIGLGMLFLFIMFYILQ